MATDRSVQVGIRTYNPESFGYTVLGADRVYNEGPAGIARRIIEIVGRHPAYLTFDIDCLDPAFAPRHWNTRSRWSINLAGAKHHPRAS